MTKYLILINKYLTWVWWIVYNPVEKEKMKDVKSILHLSPPTIYKLLNEGKIKAVKEGCNPI